MVDIAKEINKLENKKGTLNQQIQKLFEATQVPEYETKVCKCFYYYDTFTINYDSSVL
jgi:uncharacterized protein (UPF0335 family)